MNKSKNNKSREIAGIIAEYKQHYDQQLQNNTQKKKKTHIQLKKGLALNHNCDYCRTPLAGKMYMLKAGNLERFFCCDEC
jgi:hypothetical protein